MRPSKRGELEIADLLNIYKKKKRLKAEYIGRGGAWLDTGSIEDYYKTSNFVYAVENRQGLKIACLEEIALLNNWIKKIVRNKGSCPLIDFFRIRIREIAKDKKIIPTISLKPAIA